MGGRGLRQWSTSQLNNRHHKNLAPENGVTRFTLTASAYETSTTVVWCFTDTTRQTGQQVGLREGKTGYQVIHPQHEHREQRRHSIRTPWGVVGAGEWFHIHTEAFFIRSLRSPLSRAFIDTVCYQYLTQQAGKFNTDPKTYRRFLIQNKQTKSCKPHIKFFFKLLDFTGAKTNSFKTWLNGGGRE